MTAFDAADLEGGLRAIDRSLSRWKAPAWDPSARLLAAHRAASAGHPEIIPRYLRTEPPRDWPLAPFADLLRARGYLHARDLEAAAASAQRAAGADGFPFREDAVRVRAAALEAAGRGTEALEALDAAGPTCVVDAAHAAERLGDREGARRRLAAAVLDGRAGDVAERAWEALEALEPDPSLRFSTAERTRLPAAARRWTEAGRQARALELLRGARPSGAGPATLSPDEALAEAEALLRAGRPSEVGGLAARAAAAGLAPTRHGAAYVEARLRLAAGSVAAHRARLEALARVPEWSSWKGQALLDLARIAEGRPDPAALRAYRRYRIAAGDRADPLALWREAWIAFELGDAKETEAAFARVLGGRDIPDGILEAASYWQARRLEARGRRAEARGTFERLADTSPFVFYGGLAARRLGRPPANPGAGKPPDAPAAEAGAGRRWLEAARGLRRVRLLDLAGSAYGAAIELAPEPVKRAVALEAAARALDDGATAEATARLRETFGELRRVGEHEIPLPLLRLLVPVPSGDKIAAAARRAGLEPRLVASVVAEESAFNPLAVSRAGARGLLQVMPVTGAEIARRVGLTGFTPDRLFDPEVNLRLGCVQLRSMIDRLGSVPAALAAYNAGATRAARWSLPSDAAEPERFVERIPIPETRIYVKRILGNLRRFEVAWSEGLEP